MKKVLIGLLILVLLAGSFFIYKAYFSTSKKMNPLYALPPDAAYIMQFDDPFSAWQKFSNSKIWGHLKTNPFLEEITHYADSINEVVQDNSQISKLVGSRPILLSGHPVKGELEYFFIVDLENASQFMGLKNFLMPVFEEYFKVTIRDYHGHEILEMYDEEYHETLYMVIVENLLLGTYKHVLIEAALDQLAEPVIGRDLNFVEVKEELGYQGLFRLYLNLPLLLNHLADNFAAGETIEELSKVFRYTGFDFDLDDEKGLITLNGFTSMDDTVTSFYNIFHHAGAAALTIPSVLPQRTAMITSFGFGNTNGFFEFLEKVINKDPETGKTYFEGKEKLESFLDISFEENFFSWIGDELAIAQIHPVATGKNIEYAMVIKSNDKEAAIENLALIEKQIKKKTPVKFKQINYMGFTINYMSVKGLFKLILGSLFEKIEKPYYTIIDDYVIFSNHPQTLRGIIDDYLAGNVLAKESEFKSYTENYNTKSSAFIYVNTAYLLADSKSFLDEETYKGARKNENYILCFPMGGIQLHPDGPLYYNKIALQFKPLTEADEWNKEIKSLYEGPEIADDSLAMLLDSLFSADSEEEFIEVENILPDDLDANQHTEYFDNGAVRIEVSLKEGLKHGAYREYDSLGNIIIKGRYKNDMQDGLWKEYDTNGNVVKKLRYKDDQPLN